MRQLKVLITMLGLLTLWSPLLADDDSNTLSLALTQEWRETTHQTGWVVTAQLSNQGKPKTVPAQTCARVPWASVLQLRFRVKDEIRELPLSFVDIRSVHPHGPFTIGTGETLSQEIWLEDQLRNAGIDCPEGVEVSVWLEASGEPVWSNRPTGTPHLSSPFLGYEVWNGSLASNWVKLRR